MKFSVSKASYPYAASIESQPCEEAVYQEININGRMVPSWTIEINSLEDLKKFVEKYERLIIRENMLPDKAPLSLEIYDDYIE